jgi:hypothetical protein
MNNPPAFPSLPGEYAKQGMTLRDYFAAKAMQGLITNGCQIENSNQLDDYLKRAQVSYKQADAMLEVRGQ